ncbi:MAG: hypothetical protein K9N23_19655, partial [Akkermansiaceae bacterium]|nr:hypothetical protein [Akkermansiaceae bacterium]
MQVPGPVIDALSQTDDLAFTGRFCGWLETLDADTIASARTVVAAGWRSDAWPEARQAQALGWLDQRWAALDGAKFIEVCAKRTERCSSSAQAAALWVEFARDRESAMRRFAELSL